MDNDEIMEINGEAPEAPAEEITSAEETAAAEEIPAEKPKKKKTLKIILIILAFLFVLLIAGGIIVVKMLSRLGNIKPTEGITAASESFTAADTSASGTTDVSEETSGEENSTLAPDAETKEPGTTAEDVTAADTENGTTAAQSEKTTAAEKTTNTATTGASDEKTTAPAQEATTSAPVTKKNEYDIYRSGHFYAVGSMTDASGTVPMELAVTDDTLYMTSDFEGVNIGILVVGNDTYMIYPEKKAYMEVNSLFMKMMGGDADELFNADNMGFNRMGSLRQALGVTDAAVNGVSCKRYLLPDEDEFYYVYMNGNKLVRIEAMDSAKKVESTIDFTMVTENVPEEKTSPSKAYKKTGMIEFFGYLSEVME